jgi:hypothetical protein
LEQVHVRGIVCRGLRLELVAGLGIALAMPALAVAADSAQGQATQTTLTAETRDQGGRTQATVAVTVIGEDGLPAAGAVTINDNGKTLASVALSTQGEATTVLALNGGDHLLTASYAGDSTHRVSVSAAEKVHAMDGGGTPDFAIAVAPLSPATFPLTLTPGNAGTIVVTVTPENNSTLTAPMTITLSCSGLPDQSSCTATPASLQVLSTTTTGLTSSMVIQTQAASTTSVSPYSRPGKGSSPIAWALLLPGALGLGGLAWGARRRRWLNRLSLIALVGLVTVLGTTACNPRYGYFNHGPPPNPATPAGTYTVSVTGQTSNGITATARTTTFVLTVK